MLTRKLKRRVFLLTWLNVYAVAYYFNYLFFLMRDRHGFANRDNLFLAALNGFLYIFVAWYGGKFAQKRGYFTALRLGFGIMIFALAAGSQVDSIPAQFGAMLVWTLGMCFTWPTLEALVSENESPAGLARMIGIYNLTWASGAACAYFSGGALLERLGYRSLFLLPIGLHCAQFAIVLGLERSVKEIGSSETLLTKPADGLEHRLPVPLEKGKAFLRMAWLANPFAYVAMNTVIPLLPDLAARFELSPRLAGFVGSVWMFARLVCFFVLWRWTKWHYRFGWLAAAYVLMIGSFAALLLMPLLPIVLLAQIAFGFSVGLIYYSSLFYSMDVGETKGEHGGFHEALIGIGLCVGPAVATTSLRLLPNVAHAGIWTVSLLLIIGLAALVWSYWRMRADE